MKKIILIALGLYPAIAFAQKADFSFSKACSGQVIQFTDQSAYSGGTIVSWKWIFEGNGNAVTQNSTQTFANAGFYKVKLIIETNDAKKDSLEKEIEVLLTPSVNLSVSNGCAPHHANLHGSVMKIKDSLVNTYYDFTNDGIVDTTDVLDVMHLYHDPGMYSVRLSANYKGCTSTTTKSLLVQALPKAAMSRKNDTLFVSTDNGMHVFQWLKDSSMITGSDSFMKISGPGLYEVIITSIEGCQNVGAYSVFPLNTGSVSASTLYLYPNPVKESFYIEADAGAQSITVYDVLGKEVPADIKYVSGAWHVSIGERPAGIYFVILIYNSSEHLLKLVKE